MFAGVIMPSSPPKRYRSRILNFLIDGSRQLADRSARVWRSAKTATVWGVQMVLYPVYVLFQATRLAGKRLQQTYQTRFQIADAKPEPPAATPGDPITTAATDAMVLQVLRDAKYRIEGDRPTEPELQIHIDIAACDTRIQVRGIASAIATHKLVLVDANNQLLDVLTSEQQQKLYQRIVFELAAYRRAQRQMAEARQPLTTELPPPEIPPNLLPLLRPFWRMMAWVQRGSVAKTANLFHEASHSISLQNISQNIALHSISLQSSQHSIGSKSTQPFSDLVRREVAHLHRSPNSPLPWHLRMQAFAAGGDRLLCSAGSKPSPGRFCHHQPFPSIPGKDFPGSISNRST
ncbi:MAG: hypothetical protein HC925_03035 [Coleofasciculaceae cyanobacterium SM2_3_26]|nr:hypothetical protein [Coleofasciculaceae cyanobacterium SM2_3_26]